MPGSPYEHFFKGEILKLINRGKVGRTHTLLFKLFFKPFRHPIFLVFLFRHQ
jgi:hypothetical protein